MMNRILKVVLIVLISLIITLPSLAQDDLTEAKDHFCKYLNTKAQMDFMKAALPSLEECKIVFKDKSAYIFYSFVESMKGQFDKVAQEEGETFADCRIQSFTSEDIEKGRGNYAGGMKKIKDQLKQNTTFYRVTYLRKKDAEHGVSYKYFVKIEDKWVFFPKPWRALD